MSRLDKWLAIDDSRRGAACCARPNRRFVCGIAALLVVVILAAGGVRAQDEAPAVDVRALALSGPAAGADAEISGLAWYGDTLLLVVENPNEYATGEYAGTFFALPKADILATLDAADPAPLEPFAIPVIAPDIPRALPGFDGFEAAVFVGDRIYLAVEVWLSSGEMRGVLVGGDIAPDLSAITLDLDQVVDLLPQTDFQNLSYESLLVDGERLIAIYEANGADVNAQPVAYSVDLALTTVTPLPMPDVPYRVTDATAPDSDGVFWAVNFFYPGDTHLVAEADPLPRLDTGAMPPHLVPVERLVALQLTADAIRLADQPPVLLALAGMVPRNWEGIARLDDRGFLIVTDQYPTTILGFVPAGENP